MKRFIDWSLRIETRALGAAELLEQAALQLVAVGLPLMRASMILRMNHPQVGVGLFAWRATEGLTSRHIGRNNISSGEYESSPIYAVHEGADRVRRRLSGPDAQLDYVVCAELAEDGATDYFAMVLPFSSGARHFISFATDAPEGFDDDAIAALESAVASLSWLAELGMQRVLAETVCATYIGPRSGREVLRGEIARGNLRRLNAVIWFCDLRGYTALSERLGSEAVVALLNDYLQIISESVAEHGGEVLKFIGDAVLAIFPFREGAQVQRCHTGRAAVAQALNAAHEAQSRLARRNVESPGEPLLCGVAMHAGEVAYGNVGALDRLDFTVIGPAVNLASRLEGLCARLGEPILLSGPVAEACVAPVRGLGAFALKGIEEPAEVFALA